MTPVLAANFKTKQNKTKPHIISAKYLFLQPNIVAENRKIKLYIMTIQYEVAQNVSNGQNWK